MLGAGALGLPRGMVLGWRREDDSGCGTRVYLWQIHVDIWQNQYNIVKLKNKIKFKKKIKSFKLVQDPGAEDFWPIRTIEDISLLVILLGTLGH